MTSQSYCLGGSVLHLRAPFLALAPLLTTLQTAFGLNYFETGLLTTLPLVIFALVSPWVGDISRKLGSARLFGVAMAGIGAGVAIRSYMGVSGLFIGTILLATGIAIGNVLLPALVKAWYPGREGRATGIFVALMNGANALWTAVVVPVAAWIGWQLALGWWALPAMLLTWLWWRQKTTTQATGGSHISVRKLFSLPTAWWVSLFIGLQSFVFFSLVTWLPYWVMDKGFSQMDAGAMSFWFQITGIPAALVAPILATGTRRQWLTVGTCACYIIGIIWIFSSTSWAMLVASVSVMGIAAGATFSLCMLAFSLRSGSLAIATRLTGMGQALGYLLAATGPILIGSIYTWMGTWDQVLPCFLLATLAMSACGWLAMASGRIEPTHIS